MQFSLAILGAIALAQAATVPSQPWTSLTPTATYAGATTDHTHKFGIQIQTSIKASASPTAAASAGKRDVVNQINDGQIQKQTSETLSRPTPKTTASVVNQIGDGQIQHQTAKTVASVVNQIGDGQIQHQTIATASVVNQIGDGQIQHQTVATASVVNQIGDGQIQHQTTSTVATGTAANQISDGQIQATGSVPNEQGTAGFPVVCSMPDSLSMTLKGSLLTDSKGRVGAIVANRQFQFDGPPPQAGSIYAAGWSVTPDGNLAIGDVDVFYQCKSGDFYNLYDQNIAHQCEPVHLEVVDFVDC